ncbi:MAG: helix-turn-helix domain-containing protein [Planctomycetota bacterium]|nr:helix-turn-helix domain-containing protein [Planctomycetota bacterium]
MELHCDPASDPSPALTRGLLLLKRLCADGPSSLEMLAKATGWPKSSVFRLLASLEAFGAVERDPADRRYRAALRLVPFTPVAEGLRARALPVMKDLCRASGHTVELFSWNAGRLTMIDRCEPEGQDVTVRARIGWNPDPVEAFALTVGALAWPEDAKPAKERYWYWKFGERVPVTQRELRGMVAEARDKGLAVCLFPNAHGVRRYAIPLHDAQGELWGVLALAAVPAPLKGPAHEHLIRLACDAAATFKRAAAAKAS